MLGGHLSLEDTPRPQILVGGNRAVPPWTLGLPRLTPERSRSRFRRRNRRVPCPCTAMRLGRGRVPLCEKTESWHRLGRLSNCLGSVTDCIIGQRCARPRGGQPLGLKCLAAHGAGRGSSGPRKRPPGPRRAVRSPGEVGYVKDEANRRSGCGLRAAGRVGGAGRPRHGQANQRLSARIQPRAGIHRRGCRVARSQAATNRRLSPRNSSGSAM